VQLQGTPLGHLVASPGEDDGGDIALGSLHFAALLGLGSSIVDYCSHVQLRAGVVAFQLLAGGAGDIGHKNARGHHFGHGGVAFHQSRQPVIEPQVGMTWLLFIGSRFYQALSTGGKFAK